MRVIVRTAFLFLLAYGLVGCGEDPGFVRELPPAALLRVIHAVPDAPAITVDFETQRLDTLVFQSSSSLARVLPQVPRELRMFYFDGQQFRDYARIELTIEVDFITTVVMAGTLANPELIVFTDEPVDIDDLSPTADTRFVHASRNAPETVTFSLSGDPGSVSNSVTYGASSDVIAVEPGDGYELSIRNEGSELWASGEFSLIASVRPLLILIDNFGPAPGVQRVISVDAAGVSTFPDETLPSGVRLGNFIPDRTAVDFLLDGALVAEDLLYGDQLDYTTTNAETIAAQVTVANDPGSVLAEGELTVAKGQFQSLQAIGIEDGTLLNLTIDDNRPVATNANIAVSNAAVSQGTIDIYVLEPGQNVDSQTPDLFNLTYLSTNRIPLLAGDYNVVVTDNSTKDIIAGPVAVSVANANNYTLVVGDSDGGGTPPMIFLGDEFN